MRATSPLALCASSLCGLALLIAIPLIGTALAVWALPAVWRRLPF